VLRQPLESGAISVVRASGTVRYPARFQLVAAMNPCICGFLGDRERECRCRPDQVDSYRARVSGPLLNRIDLQVEVGRLSADEMLGDAGCDVAPAGESSAGAARVMAARALAARRFDGSGIVTNGEMGPRSLRLFCQLDDESLALLRSAIVRLGFTARACHRVIKVARSIADLEESMEIRSAHVAEAVVYRTLDRSVGGA